MNKIAFLSTSLPIPRLIIGLWQIADMEKDNEQLDHVKTAKYMDAYVAAGFTAFDMADHYGSSEIIAGECKNNHPDKNSIRLFTKWVPKPGPIDKNEVRKAVQHALNRMQQTSIDLMQFHAWHYTDPSWLDALTFLKELKEEGLTHNIGVTNFDAHHLRIALAHGIPIVSNQISHSVIDRRALGPMKAVCDQYGVQLLAYGTLAGGFLSNRWLGKEEPSLEALQTWSQMKYKRFIDAAGGWAVFQQLLIALEQTATKHGTSIANIASRHVLENNNVAAVIIGARLGENAHIKEHQTLLNIDLDANDVTLIEDAISQLSPVPGNCGDEYQKPPFLTASGDLSHHLETIPAVYTPKVISDQRKQVYSDTVWEEFAGYSRAVRKGNRIFVSGTTATHGNLIVGGSDAAAQAHFVIDKIEAAIESLGGRLNDVVRTRIFVNDIKDWEPVARAHGYRFKTIDPANTLVQAKLVGEGYLVEIEAEAVLDEKPI
ncbi:MAG: aryl-alcohol dehydrogenase-like predicted oxidoreductase/enamine deaminase RidA [Flavobacteriaceae bacterium]|jgi:aryl-alcohol dehydrogenase-like predicted oxidoreductase/enamine deaminase RidA (YjgF/YER057c/UK114 family)